MGGRGFRKRKKDKTEGGRGEEARNSNPAWKQQGEKAKNSSQSLAEVRMEGIREPREGDPDRSKEKTQKQRVPETELRRGL